MDIKLFYYTMQSTVVGRDKVEILLRMLRHISIFYEDHETMFTSDGSAAQ